MTHDPETGERRAATLIGRTHSLLGVARLLDWLAGQAREHQCDVLELDSGVQRFDAHRFYFRERMKISAYHFIRPLGE